MPNIRRLSGGRPRRLWQGVAPEERDRLRRERLLDAGLEVFGTTGYMSSSVASVCAQAGLSRRSFYEHFEDREALLVAVFDRITTEVAERLDAALGDAGGDLAALCRQAVAAWFHVLAGDERKARVDILEVAGVSSRVEDHRNAALATFSRVLERHLSPLVAAGVVAADRLRWAPTILAGALNQALMAWLKLEPRPPADEVVEEIARVFHAALR